MAVKFSKKEVGYEDPAKGMNHCSQCEHFEDGSCEIVSGSISSTGWCRKFEMKNADSRYSGARK